MAVMSSIVPLTTCVLLAGASVPMAEAWSLGAPPPSALDEHEGSGRHRRYRHEDADRIVRRAYQDILDREPDEAGLRQYRSRIIDDGWSEAQVREALRKSPEYRQKNTMTRQKAQEIVRRAYLAVLKREPDAGSRGYVDRVLREKWTQSDVERELRRSPEYRR
jgi:TorA maturation chaperone TorD